MSLQKEQVADTIVYLGDKAHKHTAVQEWNQKDYGKQNHILHSQASPKRLGQHISTLSSPIFISTTAGFSFLIPKTVEKPIFYN